ncbi:MAG TPA: hypothetical protein VFE46_18610 [Pirellulales bacterium]|nr:hypothetical protein [Pirellulales bacterium]
MPKLRSDDRTPQRKARDEQIAVQPQLPEPKLPPDTKPEPVEAPGIHNGYAPSHTQ